MRQDALQTIEGLSPDVVEAKPKSAEIIETTQDGGLIVEDQLPRHHPIVDGKDAKVVKTDEDGNEVWKKNQQGQEITKVHEWDTEVVTVRYKLEPRRTGKVVIKTNYSTSEEQRERELKRQKTENFMEDLAERAVEMGLTPDQLLAEMARGRNPFEADEDAEDGAQTLDGPDAHEDLGVAEPDMDTGDAHEPEKVMSTVEVGGMTAYMYAPGRWNLPNGTQLENSDKADAREALREMQQEHEAAMDQMTSGPEG